MPYNFAEEPDVLRKKPGIFLFLQQGLDILIKKSGNRIEGCKKGNALRYRNVDEIGGLPVVC